MLNITPTFFFRGSSSSSRPMPSSEVGVLWGIGGGEVRIPQEPAEDAIASLSLKGGDGDGDPERQEAEDELLMPPGLVPPHIPKKNIINKPIHSTLHTHSEK